MIGGYQSPTYTGLIASDLVLFIVALPFGIIDFYYAHRDYSCVWAPIARYSIPFPLRTWLQVDGGVLLGMAALILLIGMVLCACPIGCEGLFWLHSALGYLFALFRLAWLIIGAIMFWGYLYKYHLCASSVSTYMWINLIVGFVHAFFYFCVPCLCNPTPRLGYTGQMMPMAIPIPMTPTYRGTSVAIY